MPIESNEHRSLVSRVIACADGNSLDQVVAQLRAEGKGWRLVSRDLKDRYDVDVDFRTLHRWYGTK